MDNAILSNEPFLKVSVIFHDQKILEWKAYNHLTYAIFVTFMDFFNQKFFN